MARESLGLFDTSPSRLEIRIAIAVVGLILFILLAALPSHNLVVARIPSFVPAITVAMFVCDLITAAILFAQNVVFRSRALHLLASGYVFTSLLFIPYTLTYPGAFSVNGLLGAGINTTGWIAVAWRLAVPTAVILYAWLKRKETAAGQVAERPHPNILVGMATATALALLVTLVATIGHDLLPPFFINEGDVIPSTLIAVNVVAIALTTTAMVLLFRQERSVLDMWLLVAMFAWLAQSLLNLPLHSRFSLGGYAFLGLTFLSSLIVMLALIAESNRLYARLALSTAARDREHDERLMSMDAVAAVIAHEVGQPLTAANLNATVALRWLTAPRPDRGKAIGSLHQAIEAGQRTFDVIGSVRTTFASKRGALSEFGLNDLVRETVSLMDLELTARKVSLELSLDDALPPILGNRVQIQRVIINLLTNAIESMAATQERARRMEIRSVRAESQQVQLDVSDSGVGIAPEKMAHIFEPFFTTKSTGTGLGLSLSRTIVEEHGGRLWASSGKAHGATFHVQMQGRPGAG